MTEFRMPSLGADMEAGTLVEWLKKPGDPVKRGDVIAVVETQKGAIEIEIFEDGVVDRCLVEPGTKVPVGAPLAMIRKPGVTPGAAPPVAPTVEAPPAPHVAPLEIKPVAARAEPPSPDHVRASPAARKLALERRIELMTIAGSGPGGRHRPR